MADRKYPRHDFWGAGEPDCPPDLKAPNGELRDMRCKVCGDGWRESHDVCMDALLRHQDRRMIAKITHEQREAIVRKAVAARDALLAGKRDCSAGSPCSDCPDIGKCSRGCIRQPEFISTEFHALEVIRAGIAADRCDGDTEFASGVNAACRNHLELVEAIIARSGIPAAQQPTDGERDLAALCARLVRRLRDVAPEDKLAATATDYLSRKRYLNPLRIKPVSGVPPIVEMTSEIKDLHSRPRGEAPTHKLVPIEPTQDMLYAMAECDGYQRGDRDHPMLTRWEDYWRMAISAAPPGVRVPETNQPKESK